MSEARRGEVPKIGWGLEGQQKRRVGVNSSVVEGY